ncbi:hypothetical protein NQZ68_025186 [Dissostichus eleginoides]|nr:hypothetical protein NQZ68_025186 [Dissostichus eleginoides]
MPVHTHTQKAKALVECPSAPSGQMQDGTYYFPHGLDLCWVPLPVVCTPTTSTESLTVRPPSQAKCLEKASMMKLSKVISFFLQTLTMKRNRLQQHD